MSVFSFIGCLLNKHEPVRRHVTWSGRSYVGECRHCGTPIERHGRRDWRKRKDSVQPHDSPPTPT